MTIPEKQLYRKNNEFAAEVAIIKEVMSTISILARFKAKNIKEPKKMSEAVEVCDIMLLKHCQDRLWHIFLARQLDLTVATMFT